MKCLFIFDDHISVDSLPHFLKGRKIHSIDLFPLTSDPDVIKRIQDNLNSHGVFSVSLIDSARVINEEVKNVRQKICTWSANINRFKIGSKTVRDWLLLPGYQISTWWLSLLSEKNTLKTTAFFQIAQSRAIRNLLCTEKYGQCVTALSDRKIQKAITLITDEYKIKNVKLSLNYSTSQEGIKSKIKLLLYRSGLFGVFLMGCFTWSHFILHSIKARRKLLKHPKNLPGSDALLFVSYFPAVDTNAARNGVFKNKYALALQEKLKENQIPVIWLLMPVPFDGYDFDETLRLAKTFADNGEHLFILDEFLTLKGAFKGLLLWLRQIGLGWYLYHHLKNTCLIAEPVSRESAQIIKQLWNDSFCGSIAIGNILYCVIYKQVFKKIKHISSCIYYCEMQSWEKALNAAKNQINREIRTIGFQHSSISRNILSYFHDKTDTIRTGKSSDLPLPDVLACNGDYPLSILSESGYSGLTPVESIRYIYLEKILSKKIRQRAGKPILLVATAYDRKETRALISMVYSAFPDTTQFDIVLKGHPSMPIEETVKELGIDVKKSGYIICNDNIDVCLEKAWAMLVSTSTVSIEALTFGCEVILPVFADTMLINSLADCDKYYHSVSSAIDLREIMEKIANGYTRCRIDDYRHFVKGYWHIDSALPRWAELLNF
jgi:surface carbohydrate biosynthesis protein (TIGR04326 family)